MSYKKTHENARKATTVDVTLAESYWLKQASMRAVACPRSEQRAVCDKSSQRNFDRVSFSLPKGLCCVRKAAAAITRTLNAKMFSGARERKRKRRRLKIRTRVRKNIRRYIVFLSFVPSGSRCANVDYIRHSLSTFPNSKRYQA